MDRRTFLTGMLVAGAATLLPAWHRPGRAAAI